MRHKITHLNYILFLLLASFIALAFFCFSVDAVILDHSNPSLLRLSTHENKSQEINPLSDAVSDKILVKFKSSTTNAEIKSIVNGVGAEIIKYFDRIDVFHIKLDKGVSANETVKTLQQNPAVEYAEFEQTYHINNI